MYNNTIIMFTFEDSEINLAASLSEIRIELTDTDILIYKGNEYKGKLKSFTGISNEDFINYFKE